MTSQFLPDILTEYREIIKFEELDLLRSAALRRLATEKSKALEKRYSTLPETHPSVIDLENPIVTIGSAKDLSSEEKTALQDYVAALIPWRKGPFSLFGIEIDAEWRSDLKWNRILPALDSVAGKRIADIGCSTGYYMFRLAALNPELVLGFEPQERCYYSFHLMQHYLRNPRLDFLMLQGEQITLFPSFFDIVLCMGIVYHLRNPLQLLSSIREALKPGGQVIVESQAIPGTDSVALFPSNRYGKAKNIFFVPTANCLVSWLEKVGFSEVEVCSSVALTCAEQRRTKFSPGESLSDFLDPENPSLTVEGYPAPLRVAVRARK